jgi:hypothetical protein
MEVAELTAALGAGEKLTKVVPSLGLDCLTQHDEIMNDRYAAAQTDAIVTLRNMVAGDSLTMWGSDGAFRAAPSQAVKDQLAKVRATPALATVTVLEGICLGALRIYFANAKSTVHIERGSVVPLPERWLGMKFPKPPKLATVHPNLLDTACNSVIWPLDDWALDLDFTFRERLDRVCAPPLPAPKGGTRNETKPAHALPKIATVHPFSGNDMLRVPEYVEAPTGGLGRGRFFGVHRVIPSPDSRVKTVREAHQQVFDALKKVGRNAAIAVLPEFCLHSSDGLDALLASDHEAVPELVVAGTAHTVTGAGKKRANTSHVFLDGVHILTVSKQQAFVARLEGVEYVEDLSPLPRVVHLAAGTATRLAVTICADSNNLRLLVAMMEAGVNVLLTPSWTPKIGVADAGLLALAGYCQCVGVVANTPGHPEAEKTFWACSVVPRANVKARHHRHPGPPPVAGVLNPNVATTNKNYWTWIT